MIAMLNFLTLVVTTLFAASAAVAFDWMLLRVMFVLMRPATARRVNMPTPAVRGTAQLAQVYAPERGVGVAGVFSRRSSSEESA